MSLALLACVLFTLPPRVSAAQETPPEKAAGDTVEAPGVTITFLANAGFFLRSEQHAVLIDAFVRDASGIYAALPDAAYKQLVNANEPFDRPTLVLVSHDHADHVQYRGLEKFLVRNQAARLVTSPQVGKALANQAQQLEVFRTRVTTVPTVRGQAKPSAQLGVKVELLEAEHGGKGHEKLTHLMHLIELGGVRVLHVGDAEPAADNFHAYHLGERAIDVALVPYWYLGKPGGTQVLQEELRARVVIAYHVPPKELETVRELLRTEFPDIVLFEEALAERRFLPGGVPAPADGEDR